MAVPQVTIRLLPAIKTAFVKYAAGLGLDASELAKLLIVREAKQRRLAAMKRVGNVPIRKRQPRGSAVAMMTVTAHFSDVCQVEVFDAYAERCGLARGTAGAWILEEELKERWLQRALTMPSVGMEGVRL
jgi:hypothetical protein